MAVTQDGPQDVWGAPKFSTRCYESTGEVGLREPERDTLRAPYNPEIWLSPSPDSVGEAKDPAIPARTWAPHRLIRSEFDVLREVD